MRNGAAMTNIRFAIGNVGFCAVLCMLAWAGSLYFTEGFLTYAIDDAYIHLAHARNLAETGVWGIRPDEYAFCSSSPLWTCMLALLFKVFGFREYVPGILAIISCLGCALVIARIFASVEVCTKLKWLLIAFALIAIPVTTAAILGMEHATHVLLSLLLVHFWLVGEKSVWKWGVLSFLVVGIRYESLFVIVPLCMAMFYCRMYRQSGSMIMGALLPVFTYGVYAFAHGGSFLPNSLIVKAILLHAKSFHETLVDFLLCINVRNPLVYFSGLSMFAIAICPFGCSRLRTMAIVLGIAIFGHLVFARTGWLYNVNRYEMYLLACVSVILGLSLIEIFRYDRLCPIGNRHLVRMIVFSASLIHFAVSVVCGIINGVATLNASRETYETPMTAARIFAVLPKELQGAIYLNDLGLIAERTTVPIIDVCGLG